MARRLTTTDDRDAALAALGATLASLDERIDELEGQRREVAAAVLAIEPKDGTYPAGGIAIHVSRSRRVDTDAIEAKYPADQRPELYESHVTTTAARRHISPADLETFLKVSAASVKVK